MAQSSKVRLVRCPKCGNLLPELPDYSVYQCGGCGAVLRAKKSDPEGDRLPPERLDEARPGVLCDNRLEKQQILMGKSTPATPVIERREGTVSDSRGGVAAAETRVNKDSKDVVAEKPGVEKGKVGGYGCLESHNTNPSGVTPVDNANGSVMNSSKIIKPKASDKADTSEGLVRVRSGESEGVKFCPQNLAGEGPSSRYYANGSHGVAPRNPAELNEIEQGKPTREELLRKLEELKEQLSQSCDVNDKSIRNKVPLDVPRNFHGLQDSYTDPDDWFLDHPARYHSGLRQFCDSNGYGGGRPRYFDPYYEPVPAMDRSDYSRLSAAQDSSLGSSGYENSFGGPRLFARHHLPQRIPPGHPSNSRLHPYMSGYYPNPKLDPFEPHPFDSPQIPCTCYQCLRKQPQIPLQMLPSAHRRCTLVPNKPVVRHHENPGAFSAHESRITHPRPFVGPCDPPQLQSHNRWPNNGNLDQLDGRYALSRPQRVVFPADGGRPCQPVAGGAPFVTCHNCSELLELPKKVSHLEKSQWKICCGGCSSVISFTLGDEKLVPVDEPPPKKSLMDVLDTSEEILHDKPYDPHGGMRRDNAGFHSEEFENPSYNFQFGDKEHQAPSSTVHQGFDLDKSEELPHFRLLSSGTSDDEDSHGNFVVSDGVKDGSESPEKAVPPAPGSPLQDHFDYSSNYRAVNRCGKGSLSSRSDQERVVPGKTAAVRQNSLQDNLATEMEIHHNDAVGPYENVNGYVNKEDGQPKCKKRVDSFLAGIIKKSFRDISKPDNHAGENWKRSVMVNGHLIPDKLVKKAEKLAGPISPGQYWYDFRAGFWGVIGGPCLGIIPPHIEEFHYPMEEKCAGGNTEVFVNGRELHQMDLELLASRGLPTTKHRSYIIEISGRLLDEDSGEELDSLGKLAPTVEKVKHGFGMSTPKISV